jgi:hypothetical protein
MTTSLSEEMSAAGRPSGRLESGAADAGNYGMGHRLSPWVTGAGVIEESRASVPRGSEVVKMGSVRVPQLVRSSLLLLLPQPDLPSMR